MRCPIIIGIKLDKESIAGIERLKRINELSGKLIKVMVIGTFANIFLGNKVPEITFNIYNSDWHLFHEAVSSVSVIEKSVIEREARFQMLDHLNDSKQRQFWEAILNGCSFK